MTFDLFNYKPGVVIHHPHIDLLIKDPHHLDSHVLHEVMDAAKDLQERIMGNGVHQAYFEATPSSKSFHSSV